MISDKFGDCSPYSDIGGQVRISGYSNSETEVDPSLTS